jgi:hypothetical protein
MEPAEEATTAASSPSPPALAQTVEIFIRTNIMFILFGLLAAYYLFNKCRERMQEWQSAGERRNVRLSEDELRESVLRARMKQQEYITEQTKKDTEARKLKQEQELQERIRAAEAAKAQRLGDGTSGHRLGDGSPGPDAPSGPLSRLPKLPGGERSSYRPSTVGNGNGGHYQPSGPNSRKRGG